MSHGLRDTRHVAPSERAMAQIAAVLEKLNVTKRYEFVAAPANNGPPPIVRGARRNYSLRFMIIRA